MTETQEISVKINKNTPFVIPTTEIVGAIMATTATDDLKKAAATPAIISEELGLSIPADLQISLVENDKETLHVALPYYESLDNTHVEILDESQIELVAGGEIICIGVGALIGAKIAAVLGAKTIVSSMMFLTGGAILTGTTKVAASAATIAAGAVVGGAIGAGVAGAAAGIGVGAAAGAGALPGQNK